MPYALAALSSMPIMVDMISHFCYKTPGSAKLTGGAPGLQIRCGAVKAVPGGFDSHALPPPSQNATPGIIPGVFSSLVKTDFSKEILYNLKYLNLFYPFLAVPLLGKSYPLLVRQVLGNYPVGG